MKIIDLTGQKFERLMPIKYIGKNKWGQSLWLCQCDCGNEKIIRMDHLLTKFTQSCGCLKIERTIQSNQQRTGFKKTKKIIKQLDNNKVLAICKRHGIVKHYDRYRRSLMCCLCEKQQRNIPITNFANKLRGRISNAIKRISKNNNTKTRGCFRNLDYTPTQLYNYLNNIKRLQNNKCPHCQISYDKCTLSIDHVIPLERAKTEKEIVDLFCLQNLNLMCRSCNSSKQDKDYNVWMTNKCVKS